MRNQSNEILLTAYVLVVVIALVGTSYAMRYVAHEFITTVLPELARTGVKTK